MPPQLVSLASRAAARRPHHRLALGALSLAAAWLFTQAPAAAGVNRWTSIGPAGGYFTLAAAPGAPGTVYGLSGDGGVSRSVDGGLTWEVTGSVQPAMEFQPSIAVDPARGATVYAAGDKGIWKTVDGGATWQLILAVRAAQVAIAASAPQTVYAVAGYQGIERSGDGGASWQLVGAEAIQGVRLLAVDPSAAGTLYALTDIAFYKSLDGGVHWSGPGGPADYIPGPAGLIVDSRRPSTLYLASGTLVWRSTDAGVTWTHANAGLPQAQLRDLVEAPSGALYAAFDTSGAGALAAGIWRSPDGGASWQHVSELATSLISLAADAGAPERLYVSTVPAGVALSTDQGQTWAAPGRGPSGRHVTQVVAGRGGPGALYLTAAPASFEAIEADFLRSGDGGGEWSTLAPVWQSVSLPRLVLDAQPGILYATGSSGLGSDFISLDDGATWDALPEPPDDFSAFLDLAADPQRPGKLVKLGGFAANCATAEAPVACTVYNLYRSNTAGRHWRRLAHLLVIPPVTLGPLPGKLRLDPVHPTNVYLLAGRLYLSTAASPTPAALPLPGPVVDLAIDPRAPATLYAAVGRPRPLWKSEDGGASWRRASDGLPRGAVVTALAIDPASSATLYVATDHGVFVSDDAAASWQPLDDGLPGLPVSSLAVSSGPPRTVYAATLGAGVFALSRP
jgi:photosystem II stability/assembly factor-like uncharacterized protein